MNISRVICLCSLHAETAGAGGHAEKSPTNNDSWVVSFDPCGVTAWLLRGRIWDIFSLTRSLPLGQHTSPW